MRFAISLVTGIIVGVALLLMALYLNPMTSRNTLSPLSVSDNEVMTFRYSAVASDALVYTNDGESQVAPNPPKVLQLWEPTVRSTSAMATVLRDGRNIPAAIAIKFSSDSENTSIVVETRWNWR